MRERFASPSSCRSIPRISVALLLTMLLVFPNGVAVAQTCSSTNTWATTSNLLTDSTAPTNGLETLSAVVNNGFLYAMGGCTFISNTSCKFWNNVSYSALSKTDGSVTSNPMKGTATLNTGLARNLCGVASGGYLYVVGGVAAPSGSTGAGTTSADIERAQIKQDGTGSLKPWITQTNALTDDQGVKHPLQLQGTIALKGYLYVIGGSAGAGIGAQGSLKSDVYFAPISSTDGSIGVFKKTLSLPIPIYKTCPVVIGNTIYMLGGETDGAHSIVTNKPAVPYIYFATQNSDGSGTLTSSTPNQWDQAPYSIPPITLNGTIEPGLASQALGYVNTNGVATGVLLMGGDASGSGGDTDVVLEGSGMTDTSIAWTYPPSFSSNPALGVTSRNAGATFNHYVYSVGGLVKGKDSYKVNCLLTN